MIKTLHAGGGYAREATGEDLLAMKAVYSYLFPEVRPILRRINSLSQEIFLTQTSEGAVQKIFDSAGFGIRVPSRDGKVWLDDLHIPVIEKIVGIYEEVTPGLKGFSNSYPTSGSSQGIFHILADLKARGHGKIYTLEGEYEGYKEYGKALGIETVEFQTLEDIAAAPLGVAFISNPSARNGNIMPNDDITRVLDKGHKAIIDLAYVGMTREHLFDLTHENISAVVMSMSKPYGLFRFRTGFAFSREPIDSLYANKWFKDDSRLLTALAVCENIGPNYLYKRYSGLQERIVSDLNNSFGTSLGCSDVFLIANSKDDSNGMLQEYRRGKNHRLCLTPYFESYEKIHAGNSMGVIV